MHDVAVRLTLGAYDELRDDEFLDVSTWRLSEPDRAGADHYVTLDYVGEPFASVGSLVRIGIVLDGVVAFNDASPFEVTGHRQASSGTCSLDLAGKLDSLWCVSHLSKMAVGASHLSARLLTNDAQRRGWVRAALALSHLLTPWIWRAETKQGFTMTRPVPEQISVVIDPELFGSKATFFSLIGERLLGPAGYAGRDLQGFSEIVREVAHVVPKLEVSLVDRSACERAAEANFEAGDRSFVHHVCEILSESTTVETRSW